MGFQILMAKALACAERLRLLASRLRAWALVGLTVAGTAANAADNEVLTLREAMAATLAANPELKMYGVRSEALAGLHETVSLVPPLIFNAAVEDALGTGSAQAFKRSEITLSLSQVVELGDQHQRHIDVASQRLVLLQAEQQVSELDLLAEVARRFIAVAAAQERLALRQRAAQLAQDTQVGVNRLVAAAQSPQAEQTRANAALQRALLEEQHASANLAAARINLASLWASQQPSFSSVAAQLFETGAAGDLTALLVKLDANPAIQVFASEERLREAELQAALSERRGDLQWTAGLRHLREVGDSGFVVGMSYPLNSQARATGAIRTANANVREVEGRKQVARNHMQSQLHALHVQLQQAIAEATALQATVLPLLRTALEQTRAVYAAGGYSYAELASAQLEALNAENAMIDVAERVHLLRCEIERLGGAAFTVTTEE